MGIDGFGVICGSHGIAPAVGIAGITGALFVAGLVGSVAHCGPMCGPLVIAQSGKQLAQVSASRLCEVQRLRSSLLLSYHLGRLTTYAVLGAGAALFGKSLSALPYFPFLAGSLLIIAAGVLIGKAVLPPKFEYEISPDLWSKIMRVAAERFTKQGFMNGYGLGLFLGFIPCGLLYAALTTCAATADPMVGAVGMIVFGLGTVPTLAGVGLIGQVAANRFRRLAKLAQPIILTFDAGLLLVLAIAWII